MLPLAACGAKVDQPGGETIECRLPDQPAFEAVCSLEKVSSPEGRILILRRPDGGFHRLQVVKDGRGVIAADGAEPVRVSEGQGSSIEVEVGSGVFRLPARITP